ARGDAEGAVGVLLHLAAQIDPLVELHRGLAELRQQVDEVAFGPFHRLVLELRLFRWPQGGPFPITWRTWRQSFRRANRWRTRRGGRRRAGPERRRGCAR